MNNYPNIVDVSTLDKFQDHVRNCPDSHNYNYAFGRGVRQINADGTKVIITERDIEKYENEKKKNL